MAPITPVAAPETGSKHEKKHKKDKSAKKRAREEDAAADGERRHKKSKSVPDAPLEERPAAEALNGGGEKREKKKKDKKDKKIKHSENAVASQETELAADEAKTKKKHKKKHRETNGDAAPVEDTHTEAPGLGESVSSKKKHKKKRHHEGEAAPDAAANKSERKKKKKSKKHRDEDDAAAEPGVVQTQTTAFEESQKPDADNDAMDVDQPVPSSNPSKSSKSKIHQPPDIPANPQFPFFTQTVSLYEPLYPVGWAQPVTSAQQQHLKHLQNRYVPALRGVLLDYRGVSFGERPGRPGAAADDDHPATVLSRRESAVGFGWLTADVDLFVPSRGAWMEGSVNLHTEGHVGVVCFGRFNASIEASRLPRDWQWVSSDSSSAAGDGQSAFGADETASLPTAADDHGVVRQVHSTGYWADGAGERVRGRVRFRIRNFDVGASGDTSYLSLEGTMLDGAAEKAVVAEEARAVQARRAKGGKGGAVAARRERRRAPEFAVTRFEEAGEEQEQAQAQEQDTQEGKLEAWKGDQPEGEETEDAAEAVREAEEE